MSENITSDDWEITLSRLSEFREQGTYSTENIHFIKRHLASEDERIRAAATLAAEGCVFEPDILDMILELAENDDSLAIRIAAVRVLGTMIYEGVMQNFEDQTGADTNIEYYEEWDEIQTESLREDYLSTKNLLLRFLEDDFEQLEIRETALISLSDLGSREVVRDWIREFIDLETPSSKAAALRAMGKFPAFWISQLGQFLDPTVEKSLLLEAISSSYSSESQELADKLVALLEFDDPDILEYTLLSLANINKTKGLGEILQNFILHPEKKVREAAKKALENYSKKSFSTFLEDELGMEE